MEPQTRPLRIATVAYRPYANPCSAEEPTLLPTRDCPKPGVEPHILGEILKMINVSYELIPFVDSKYDNDYGATWENLLMQMINGTVDTISAKYPMDAVNNKPQFLIPNYPITSNEVVFVMARRPELDWEKLVFLVYRVFSAEFYLCFLSVLLLLGMTLLLSKSILPRNLQRLRRRISRPGTVIMKHNAMELVVKFPLTGQKSLIVMASFYLLLIGGIYQGCLSAKLLLPKPYSAVKGLDALIDQVEQGRYTFVTENADRQFYRTVRTSQFYYFTKLRRAFVKNPVVVEPNMTRILDLLDTGRYVYEARRFRAMRLIQKRCLLELRDLGDAVSTWQTYVFHKDAPLNLSLFGESAVMLLRYGQMIEDKYAVTELYRHCEADVSDSGVDADGRRRLMVQPVSVLSVLGTLVLLGGGVLAAAIVLLVEWICRLNESHKAQQRQQPPAQGWLGGTLWVPLPFVGFQIAIARTPQQDDPKRKEEKEIPVRPRLERTQSVPLSATTNDDEAAYAIID